MQTIRNHKWVKGFKKYTNSNDFISIVAKIMIGTTLWLGVLIPTWIYLIVRWVADPAGFWQELAILVVCMLVMGWLQVLLAIGGFFLTIAILIDDTI